MIRISIAESSPYEAWIYENCAQWKWDYLSGTMPTGWKICGIWLEDRDAVAFRLKFGL